MLRRSLIAAADSARLRHLAMTSRAGRAVALRFVAGETLDDAVAVVRRHAADGFTATLDLLGESVTDLAIARAAADQYLIALDRLDAEGLPSGISVKPTALGIDVDEGVCTELFVQLCTAADRVGRHVTIDMEGSPLTQRTIDLTTDLVGAGHDVGCAVQAYLHRTLDDVERLTAAGASLRITKGAYAEPEELAGQEREWIRENFVRIAELVLDGTTYGRFATHDDVVIDRIRAAAEQRGVAKDRFEFQMLHGIREPLQRELRDAGYAVRIYVPFGEQWYPYLTRRLAERPANLWFFARALAGSLRDR